MVERAPFRYLYRFSKMEPLTSTTVAVRRWVPYLRAEFMLCLVDLFLGLSSTMTLVKATSMRETRLIRRVACMLSDNCTGRLLCGFDFNNALVVALRNNDEDIAKTLILCFKKHDEIIVTTAVATAAGFGKTNYLQWLYDQDILVCWGGRNDTLALVAWKR